MLDALARALQLDDAERAHLFDLARAAQPIAPARAAARPSSASAPRCSSCSTRSPAPPRTSATNASTSSPPTRSGARCSSRCSTARSARNAARFVFLDPRARDFYLDWDRIARDVVALLRSAAGRNPYDRDLTDLVGELSTRSEEFRQHWARHDVRFHISGVKRFHHPHVGDLRAQLRAPRRRLRHRPDDLHLHRRPRHAVRGRARPARQLAATAANEAASAAREASARHRSPAE